MPEYGFLFLIVEEKWKRELNVILDFQISHEWIQRKKKIVSNNARSKNSVICCEIKVDKFSCCGEIIDKFLPHEVKP